MPTPISNTNSCFYDPNAQFSSVSPPDPGLPADGDSAVPRVITVPPIVITGEAGAPQLVNQYDAARPVPDCSQEGKNAALSCAKAGVAAAGGALLSTTVVAAGVAAAATLAEAFSCGKDLRTYYDCKTR